MNDITTDDILDIQNTIKNTIKNKIDSIDFKNMKQPNFLSFDTKNWKQIAILFGVIFTMLSILSAGTKKIYDFLKYFKYIAQYFLPLLFIVGCILFYMKLQTENVTNPILQEQSKGLQNNPILQEKPSDMLPTNDISGYQSVKQIS